MSLAYPMSLQCGQTGPARAIDARRHAQVGADTPVPLAFRWMTERVTVKAGDVVMIGRARTFFAVVERASATELAVMPCDPRVPDRRVKVSEVLAVYRNVGKPAAPPRKLRPSPQMRLDGTT
jgi:hypothetical protein